MVTVEITITVNVASAPTGTLEVTGLPFTASSTQKGAVAIAVASATAAATTTWVGSVTASSTNVRLYTYAAGALSNPGDYIQNGTVIAITATYSV